jgi:hypothetical protein
VQVRSILLISWIAQRGRGTLDFVSYLVWISAWQLQCCGKPFAVGQKVTWALSPATDPRRFGTTLGKDLARRITHAEDHHNVLSEHAVATPGSVLAISSAFCRYAADPGSSDGKTLVPVPGTAVLRDVTKATGREPETASLRFNGYVVELRVEPDDGRPW